MEGSNSQCLAHLSRVFFCLGSVKGLGEDVESSKLCRWSRSLLVCMSQKGSCETFQSNSAQEGGLDGFRPIAELFHGTNARVPQLTQKGQLKVCMPH